MSKSKNNELSDMLHSVLDELDSQAMAHWGDGSASHGFWRTGSIPPITPMNSLRKHGYWQGRATLEKGLYGQISVSLIGGATRVGVFIPNQLLDSASTTYGESLTDAVSKAYNGQPASIIRRMGGDTLFDHILTEAPFSAEWFLRSARDSIARDILINHIVWVTLGLWQSTMRTIISQQSHTIGTVLHSSKPIPVSITESLPLTFQDVFEVESDHWVTIVRISGDMPIDEIERSLQAQLPEHDITVQMDTYVDTV